MITLTPEEYKKKYGEVGYQQLVSASSPTPEKKSTLGTLTGPLQDGISGLKTLYGGGEQGIANKLKTDIQQGASDINTGYQTANNGNFLGGLGQVFKGVAKSGLRTAGDVAGAVYAPIGAAISSTGFGKATDYVADKLVNHTAIGNALTDNKSVQNFAMEHPNAGEDFGRALNLAFASADKGSIDPKTALSRTKAQLTPQLPDSFNQPAKPIEQARADKIKQGFEDQNTRLKSVDRAFNKNTKTYSNPTTGEITKITPIDTLGKYNITPTVEKGTINMGDYQTGQGALGKIREHVSSIDGEIDTKLKDSGQGVPIDQFKQLTIERIKSDPDLQRAGKVSSTEAKLNNIFEDYKNSYGDTLNETEINAIRKVMNQDFHPDTVDVSRIVGDAARKIIYDTTPDGTIKQLLRQQGELLAAKKYGEVINGTKVTGGRLGNMAMRTGGAIIGSTLHNLPVIGPLIGMVGGEYMGRALQQGQFKDFAAEGRNFIDTKLGQRTKSTTPVTKDATGLSTKGVIGKTIDRIKNTPNQKGGFIKVGGDKLTPESKLPTVERQGVSSTNNSTLVEEAKKYKSADEFVKAMMYHGTAESKIAPILKEGLIGNRGRIGKYKGNEVKYVSFADDPNNALNFATGRGENAGMVVTPKPKSIYDLGDTRVRAEKTPQAKEFISKFGTNELYWGKPDAVKWLKAKGYDAISFMNPDAITEIRVLGDVKNVFNVPKGFLAFTEHTSVTGKPSKMYSINKQPLIDIWNKANVKSSIKK